MSLSTIRTALTQGAASLLRHPLTTLLLVAGGMLSVAVLERRNAAESQSALLTYFETQRALNDSTQARTAAAHLKEVQALQGLVEAAHAMNGKLVAGFAIAIARRDTTVRHATLPTTRLPDSTRVATLHDSTFAGLVDATITAPPFPAPLGATLTVTRPAFRPEVGFVKVGSGYIATVTWNGEHYQIDAPFYSPAAVHSRWVTPWVAGTWLSNGTWQGTAGVMANVGSLHVGPTVQVGDRLRGGVTGAWTF